jgi:hypothetical protein
MALAEPVIGKVRARNALDRWWQVEKAEDVSALMQLLDVGAAAQAHR